MLLTKRHHVLTHAADSVVIHCMDPEARQYYDLESLWAPGAGSQDTTEDL